MKRLDFLDEMDEYYNVQQPINPPVSICTIKKPAFYRFKPGDMTKISRKAILMKYLYLGGIENRPPGFNSDHESIISYKLLKKEVLNWKP